MHAMSQDDVKLEARGWMSWCVVNTGAYLEDGVGLEDAALDAGAAAGGQGHPHRHPNSRQYGLERMVTLLSVSNTGPSGVMSGRMPY